ncbi:MAG TPA: hypothetical protein DCM08_03425 [Microscillaceae bacterium]|nr:hypothetical protein [Microscillaceae bacterium]
MKLSYLLRDELTNYYPVAEIEKSIRFFVPTQCQNIMPSLEEDTSHQYAFVTKQPIIPFFIERFFSQFSFGENIYLALGDAGMGKTTFLINLYAQCLQKIEEVTNPKFQWKDLLPLKHKDHQLQLTETQLPNRVKILPLGVIQLEKELSKISEKERKRTILLLDAFDEDSEALKNYRKRFAHLLQLVKDFAHVLITCRTQFFPPEEEESDEAGLLKFRYKSQTYEVHKLYVSPFDGRDIQKYLAKNYSFFDFAKRHRAEQIVQKSPTLMVRPMILSYIDDLIQNRSDYQYTYQIYDTLIKKWVEREAKRQGKQNAFSAQDLYKFAKAVAVNIYFKKSERRGLFIEEEQILALAKAYQIQVSGLELKSRSLLTQNVRNQFKFAHKSILEYFLALEIIENGNFAKDFDFDGFELLEQFLNDMSFERIKTMQGYYKSDEQSPLKQFKDLKAKSLIEVRQVILHKATTADIQALRTLPALEVLYLNTIALKGEALHNLLYEDRLDLSHRQISDIAILQDLIHLRELDLSYNQVNYLNPLRKLKNLEKLNLSHNRLSELVILGELKQMKYLNLDHNLITNIQPLQNLTSLHELSVEHNQISQVAELSKLPHLQKVSLQQNPITQEEAKHLKVAWLNRSA